MDKAELEKETKIRVDALIDVFKQDIKSDLYDRLNQEDIKDFLYSLYRDCAEPREKQIQVLGERCSQLQKDKGNLTDKVKELEQQIEKMKCCSNCDNWNWKHSKCEKKLKGDCFKQSKWILRR